MVWGGARHIAELDGEPIPLNSDVTFEVDFIKCGRDDPPSPPDPPMPDPPQPTIKNDTCFYIHVWDDSSQVCDLVWACSEPCENKTCNTTKGCDYDKTWPGRYCFVEC